MFDSVHPLFNVLALGAALATLSACGGGDAETALPVTLTTPPAAASNAAHFNSVLLEGCVVDEHYIPRTDTTVRATTGDGRLIGHATSDRHGLYMLLVPLQQTVSVTVDKTGGDVLVVRTGRSDLAVGTCLRDRNA